MNLTAHLTKLASDSLTNWVDTFKASGGDSTLADAGRKAGNHGEELALRMARIGESLGHPLDRLKEHWDELSPEARIGLGVGAGGLGALGLAAALAHRQKKQKS